MEYIFTIFDKDNYINELVKITNIDKDIITSIVDTYLLAVLKGELSFQEASSNIETAIYNNLLPNNIRFMSL